MFQRPRQLSKEAAPLAALRTSRSGYQVPSPVNQSKGGKATQASFRNWEGALFRAIIAQKFAQRQSFPPHPLEKTCRAFPDQRLLHNLLIR